MARCKSCEALITWATWEHTGKTVPVDEKPNPKGNLAMLPGAKVRIYGLEDAAVKRDRYMPHHATCPDADQWRGRR